MDHNRPVLVIGAAGMLGHTMMRVLALDPALRVMGTVRNAASCSLLPPALRPHVHIAGDLTAEGALATLLDTAQPRAIINCAGLIKQAAHAEDPLAALPVNSMLPHRLMQLCATRGIRLVHVSTDCVFSGTRGNYLESDTPDARDVYGLSKYLGEVAAPHAVTLRTSIIGPELGTAAHGLLGWFLSQHTPVRGFTRAVFSGLPTVELARIVRDIVLPDASLQGLYHVAAAPINKHDLLCLVAQIYGRDTDIAADDTLVIDRSLNAGRFHAHTGYTAPAWPELVRQMHEFG
jgi:dTDP-4-dehydrorhamnose reductase